MSYKWKPSKAQRKEFAQRMKNPEEQAEYLARKSEKSRKRRSESKFGYESAGGSFIPTQAQYQFVMNYTGIFTDTEQNAANQIIFGFTCNEVIRHDDIHIINELIRKL